MAQQEVWEQEYSDKKLVGGDMPSLAFRNFCKWLKKELKKSHRDAGGEEGTLDVFDGLRVLDLGSGEGKNALYLAERGAKVIGVEIATNAVAKANVTRGEALSSITAAGGELSYMQGSIGEKIPLEDGSFDVLLDVTSSNSLTEAERARLLSEMSRLLKPSGYIFIRALCKDGDDNAKKLLNDHPGKEYDTYVMPGFGLIERVFSEKDFRAMYGANFKILKLEKETHYTKFEGRTFKRNFWVGYLQKI